jgi:hypothetical protein
VNALQIRVRRGKTEASAPLTVEEVSIAMQTGDLKPTDEYWSEGLQQWRPLADIERGPLGGLPDRSGLKLHRHGQLPIFSILAVLLVVALAIFFIPLLGVKGSCCGCPLTVIGRVIIVVVGLLWIAKLVFGPEIFQLGGGGSPKSFITPTDDTGNTVEK